MKINNFFGGPIISKQSSVKRDPGVRVHVLPYRMSASRMRTIHTQALFALRCGRDVPASLKRRARLLITNRIVARTIGCNELNDSKSTRAHWRRTKVRNQPCHSEPLQSTWCASSPGLGLLLSLSRHCPLSLLIRLYAPFESLKVFQR